MGKFMYVFDIETRDKLIALGYAILKSDDRNNVYVFVYQPEMDFALSDSGGLISDTLTF